MDIKKTIENWVASAFPLPNSCCQATIEQLPVAPPFLFTGSTDSGYCVTIKPASSDTESTPQLGFWIPNSGDKGTQCTLRNGDEEIVTFAVDWFKATRVNPETGEKIDLLAEDALLENLSSRFAAFLRDEILLPALEKCLDDSAIAHEPFTIDMVSGIEPWDEKNWTFRFLGAEPITSSEPYSQPDWSTSRVLGITGDGRAAFFSYSRHEVDPRGYVDYINLESQATGIDSPATMQSFFEEVFTAKPINNN